MDDSGGNGGKDEKVEEKSRALLDLLEWETWQLRTILHPVRIAVDLLLGNVSSANEAATFL